MTFRVRVINNFRHRQSVGAHFNEEECKKKSSGGNMNVEEAICQASKDIYFLHRSVGARLKSFDSETLK